MVKNSLAHVIQFISIAQSPVYAASMDPRKRAVTNRLSVVRIVERYFPPRVFIPLQASNTEKEWLNTKNLSLLEQHTEHSMAIAQDKTRLPDTIMGMIAEYAKPIIIKSLLQQFIRGCNARFIPRSFVQDPLNPNIFSVIVLLDQDGSGRSKPDAACKAWAINTESCDSKLTALTTSVAADPRFADRHMCYSLTSIPNKGALLHESSILDSTGNYQLPAALALEAELVNGNILRMQSHPSGNALSCTLFDSAIAFDKSVVAFNKSVKTSKCSVM